MKDVNDSWYVIEGGDGVVYETPDKAEAKRAIQEGRPVTKNTRRIFSSGNSDIRLYVSTDIYHVKDL